MPSSSRGARRLRADGLTLADDDDPVVETVYSSRSRSRSTPIVARSGTTTFLSRIALRTTAVATDLHAPA
jgi:hypothetical protein